MITCEACGKAAPKNTDFVERGVVTTYRLVANPKTGNATLVTADVTCSTENEHSIVWECDCGERNDVAAEIWDLATLDPIPEHVNDSQTHSICDNCGRKWTNGRLRPIQDLVQRLDPNGAAPTGQCPKCSALCYPSTD
jgi:hypothetical protein